MVWRRRISRSVGVGCVGSTGLKNWFVLDVESLVVPLYVTKAGWIGGGLGGVLALCRNGGRRYAEAAKSFWG